MIWTDYKRINSTHFKSKSSNSVVGKVHAPEQNAERFQQKCKESWTRRWWGPSWTFQSYPVVLSDLKGKLRWDFNSPSRKLMGQNSTVE